MSERNMPIDQVHLTELPVIVRIVSILDLASLSILELLEYNLERREINRAISEGVIAIDKIISPSSSSQLNHTEMMEDNILLRGESYFYNFVNSKVRLIELGLFVLDSITEDLSNPPTRPHYT
jgi:hypothetical protein